MFYIGSICLFCGYSSTIQETESHKKLFVFNFYMCFVVYDVDLLNEIDDLFLTWFYNNVLSQSKCSSDLHRKLLAQTFYISTRLLWPIKAKDFISRFHEIVLFVSKMLASWKRRYEVLDKFKHPCTDVENVWL